MRDLWNKENLGTYKNKITEALPAHGSRLFTIKPGGNVKRLHGEERVQQLQHAWCRVVRPAQIARRARGFGLAGRSALHARLKSRRSEETGTRLASAQPVPARGETVTSRCPR